MKTSPEIERNRSYRRVVREWCANWDNPREMCHGITTENKQFRDPGKCWIFEGEECDYFKSCVLPGWEQYRRRLRK